jgi:hypothetical protein
MKSARMPLLPRFMYVFPARTRRRIEAAFLAMPRWFKGPLKIAYASMWVGGIGGLGGILPLISPKSILGKTEHLFFAHFGVGGLLALLFLWSAPFLLCLRIITFSWQVKEREKRRWEKEEPSSTEQSGVQRSKGSAPAFAGGSVIINRLSPGKRRRIEAACLAIEPVCECAIFAAGVIGALVMIEGLGVMKPWAPIAKFYRYPLDHFAWPMALIGEVILWGGTALLMCAVGFCVWMLRCVEQRSRSSLKSKGWTTDLR